MRHHLLRTTIKALFPVFLVFTIAGACSATTFITPSDDQLMIESRGIVTGKVLSMGSAYDETTGFVFTYVRVRIREVLKGNISTNVIVLKEVGGQAGVHGTVIFSRPRFAIGERALLYLDTWPDGSLRVRDQFLGKFSISRDSTTGQLMVERFGPQDEDIVIPISPGGQTTNKMEYSSYLRMLQTRLTVNMQRSAEFEQTYFASTPMLMSPAEYNAKIGQGLVEPVYHLFNPPARWNQPDSGQAVTYVINTTGQPSANAVADVDAAMRCWSTVTGCSLRIVDGGTTSACSSLVSNEGLVDFNNCRGFFSSSGGTCQGILAEGGANFTSAGAKVVNGTLFDQITSSFISFNPFAACSFSSDCNVEEITTHEMGHSIGMQHSWDPSFGGTPTAVQQAATMYYIAHFDGRCASVMSDDIAGITFVYPGSSHAYAGFQDGAGCGTISGWAWDGNSPSSTVSVDIFDGTTLIGTTAAGMYREDLLNVLASPNHGFSFPTPAGLKNGASHSITVKISGTSIALGGGPKTLTCSEASVSLQGFHDGVGCNNISGWARDVNDPGNIVNVDVYNGSTLIGTIAATQYRQDLADAFGNPFHGFNFPMPASLKDGQPHTITVKFGSTSTVLSNSPKTFTCSEGSQNLQGSQDVPTCTSITGFAWDANDNGSTINVAIYADGNFLVTIPAQQVSAGVGSGFHGYIYAVPASLKDGNSHSYLVRFSGTSTAVTNSPRAMTCP